jgi:hypothetical protein
MADLLASQVTLQGSLAESEFYSSKQGNVVRRVKITGGTAGGATNRITAASLGLKKLVGCTSLFDAAGSKIYPAAVDPVNNILVLGSGTPPLSPTDLAHTNSVVTVWGY